MSPEQQKQLLEIRKRKQELLLEIQVSNKTNHFMSIIPTLFYVISLAYKTLCL